MIEQQLYEIRAGTIIFFRPYQLHHIRMDIHAEQAYIRSMFLFEPSILLDYLKPFPALTRLLLHIWKSPFAIQVVNKLSPAYCIDLFNALIARTKQASSMDIREDNALHVISFLQHIKPMIDTLSLEQVNNPMPLSSTVTEIMLWVNTNYSQEFHLSELAERVHLSPNHVSYLFRKETGMSISEYVIAARMRQATILLKTTNQTIQEIGQQIGLTNFPYFCQLFKKTMGSTPNQYRKSQIP
ncbi:Bifunctional transcriptional activator/DNA repair enzyme AdaA [compost metagenome]